MTYISPWVAPMSAEKADVIGRPLLIIFERPWQLGVFFKTRREQVSHLSSRKAKKKINGTTGQPASCASLGR